MTEPGGALLALVGPTAAGKSRMAVEVALQLAERGPAAEIISCDSMAVYRGLDIVAAKPPAAERAGVPHHLLDVAEPHEDFTAVRYRQLARERIARVQERGRLPMLTGGSGLYFRAAVDELEFAPTDPEARARLEASDPAELYARLERADPEAAARTDPRNPRRVVRAVEILELTGRPPSELRRSWDRRESPYRLVVAGLTWQREELYRRVAERVRRDFEAGFIEEVRRIGPGRLSRTAGQAVGVEDVAAHLEGRISRQEAEMRVVRRTKNLIRSQMGWFRADPRVVWVDASELGWQGARAEIVALFARPGV